MGGINLEGAVNIGWGEQVFERILAGFGHCRLQIALSDVNQQGFFVDAGDSGGFSQGNGHFSAFSGVNRPIPIPSRWFKVKDLSSGKVRGGKSGAGFAL